MEISQKLRDFLNSSYVIELIADEDWKKLFSKAERLHDDVSTLHKILVKSNIASTDQILYSLDYVPGWFFHGFDDLTSITLPNNITSIGNNAFFNCASLENITLPNNITSIDNAAFYNCNNLTSITIPDSLTSIGKYVFSYCSSLISITIPNSVTSISDYTFWSCRKLTSITLPNSLTSIGKYVFRYCNNITSITIPNSVTSIGDYAFQDCDNLKTIYFNGTKDQWKQVKKAGNWKSGTNSVKIICRG